jgi:hypothetical protein
VRACNRADRETKLYVKKTLAEAGETVKADAASRFASYDTKSAAGFRSKALVRGVFVGQRLRKTTGKHPWYGALQMIVALRPALRANQGRIIRDFEHAMDRVCDHFDNG